MNAPRVPQQLRRTSEGSQNFIDRMKSDGSGREKASPNPVLEILSISPSGRWAATWAGVKSGALWQIVADPLDGNSSLVSVCGGYCNARWDSVGTTFVVVIDSVEGVFTMVSPVNPAGGLPALPPNGVVSRADLNNVKGAKVLEGWLMAGPLPGQFVSRHEDVHRNLYRIPLR